MGEEGAVQWVVVSLPWWGLGAEAEMEVRRVAGSSSMGVEDLGVLAPLRRLGVMVWTVANLVATALRDGL